MTHFSTGLNGLSGIARSSLGPHVEAVSAAVVEFLVAAKKDVCHAGLADSRRSQDDDAGAGVAGREELAHYLAIVTSGTTPPTSHPSTYVSALVTREPSESSPQSPAAPAACLLPEAPTPPPAARLLPAASTPPAAPADCGPPGGPAA